MLTERLGHLSANSRYELQKILYELFVAAARPRPEIFYHMQKSRHRKFGYLANKTLWEVVLPD
jgi:hypothetical protein